MYVYILLTEEIHISHMFHTRKNLHLLEVVLGKKISCKKFVK